MIVAISPKDKQLIGLMVGLLNFLLLIRNFNYSLNGAEDEFVLAETKALSNQINRALSLIITK
jgi:hypothetical protein